MWPTVQHMPTSSEHEYGMHLSKNLTRKKDEESVWWNWVISPLMIERKKKNNNKKKLLTTLKGNLIHKYDIEMHFLAHATFSDLYLIIAETFDLCSAKFSCRARAMWFVTSLSKSERRPVWTKAKLVMKYLYIFNPQPC